MMKPGWRQAVEFLKIAQRVRRRTETVEIRRSIFILWLSADASEELLFVPAVSLPL